MWNKRSRRTWLAIAASALMLLAGNPGDGAIVKAHSGTAATDASNGVSMILDGKVWQPKDEHGEPVYPLIIDGTSYLPVRALAEALGVEIGWDDAARAIRIGKDAHTTPVAAAPAVETDKTKLPLGDGKYTTEGPKKGYIYVQRPLDGRGGAYRDGEWIDQAEGTFDITKKAVVDGSVHWDSELVVELKGNQRVITGNRLPEHTTGRFPIAPSDDAYQYDRNPNRIKEQMYQVVLPANPVPAPRAEPVSLGAVGVMLTGALIFNGLDAMGRDAVAHETQDSCYGHPEMDGSYHYHNLSACIDDAYTGEHSKLVGYALDGFGIYGKYGEGGAYLSNDDLDEFHGHTHTIEWDGKQVTMYHYHTTDEYPYTIGAFKGKPAKITMNP